MTTYSLLQHIKYLLVNVLQFYIKNLQFFPRLFLSRYSCYAYKTIQGVYLEVADIKGVILPEESAVSIFFRSALLAYILQMTTAFRALINSFVVTLRKSA